MFNNPFKSGGGGAWGGGQKAGGAWGNSAAGAKYEDDEEAPPPQNTRGLFANTPGVAQPPPQPAPMEVDGGYGYAEQQQAGPSGGAFGAMGGAFGGAFGFGKKNQNQAPPPPPPYGGGYGGMGPPPPGVVVPPGFTPGMMAEVSQKERDLMRREEELRRREQELARMNNGDVEKKRNWPICCPLLYHNIAEECMPEKIKMVRAAYLCFQLFCVFNLWQWICVTTMVLVFKGSGVAAWFLACIYLLIGIPGALWLWYRRIYNLGKTGSGHVLSMAFMAVHAGFCLYCAIAIPVKSSQAVDGGAVTGYLSAADAFSKKTYLGIMYITGAVAWTVETTLAFVVLGWIYKDFRGRPQ